MEIVLKVAPHTAQALRSNDLSDEAREIHNTVASFGSDMHVKPMVEWEQTGPLSQYFVVEGARPGSEYQIAAKLRTLKAVTGAYTKPDAELPAMSTAAPP